MTAQQLALVCAALAIAFGSLVPAQAQEKKCGLTEIASLPITETSEGVLTVPVKVGGDTVQFLLAIDQHYTAITYALINSHDFSSHPFGNPAGTSSFSYMGQTADSKAYVPSLKLENADFTNNQILAIPEPPAPGTAGVLGLDLLSKFDVELNLQAGRLNLFLPDHCPGEVVYWNRPFTTLAMTIDDGDGTPYFGMQLDGKVVLVKLSVLFGEAQMGSASAKELFGLDTASPGVTARPDLTRTFELRRPSLEDIPGTAKKLGDVTLHYYQYTFGSLSLNGIEIKSLQTVLYPEDKAAPCHGEKSFEGPFIKRCFGGADLRLGRRELRRMRLYFAFKEQQLYVTAPDPEPTGAALPQRSTK